MEFDSRTKPSLVSEACFLVSRIHIPLEMEVAGESIVLMLLLFPSSLDSNPYSLSTQYVVGDYLSCI